MNDAALTIARPFFEIDPAEWDDLIATNLRGTYFGCRVAGLHMRGRGSGRIINLSSIVGQRGPSVNGVHYAASKAGILAITRFRGDRAGAARQSRSGVSGGLRRSPRSSRGWPRTTPGS